ncbi:hypothetical protein ACFPFP_05620 [Bradyrhizobium sp. GCM10023182]|uniref:Glycosyltransferase family 1 protein n=1 Tax=Bradyrhizobium zhengyangense TaxID=2911009 RepID=A0ABS9LI01_9BRAD|nr:hypothetical protein [Bradyrhizobium zhengyangense]MCG2666409.1 hypothetical protein [Bradyrhizobium zhengyangense]
MPVTLIILAAKYRKAKRVGGIDNVARAVFSALQRDGAAVVLSGKGD